MLKKRMCYLALLIVSFWLMVMYEGVFVEGMFAAVVMVPVVLIIIKHITRLYVRCKWNASSIKVTAGKKIRITAIIENMSIFPINRAEIKFQITDISGNRQTYRMVTNLMPFTDRKCAMDICPNYSGAITVKLISVRIYDFLGLTRTSKKIGSVLQMAIFPELERIQIQMSETERFAAEESDTYSEQIQGTDKTQIFDISPYRDGDNIKDIHWKLSLKTDDFVVKKYSLPVSSETKVYVDFEVSGERKIQACGVDKFFSYVFSIIEELKQKEENVNLYLFDSDGGGYYRTEETSLLLNDYSVCPGTEIICDTFSKCVGNGRNILISSRLVGDGAKILENNLEDYYVDIDSGNISGSEILIGDTKIIGVDITGRVRDEKEFVNPGDELYVNSDDEEMGIYTNVFRFLLILFGSFVPVAILLDTVVIEDSFGKIFIYAMAATGAMCLSRLIKKKKYKAVYIAGIIALAALYSGINNIITGAVQFAIAFGNKMQVPSEINGYSSYGLTDSFGLEITTLLALVAFCAAILLFGFTWNSISITIHLVLTVPFVVLCYAFGCVPSGVYIVMYSGYVFALLGYWDTYVNIVKNEKGLLKKAFYESTLNIGAICGYIMIAAVMIVMFLDAVKGYDRSQSLIDIKTAVNGYLEEFDIQKLFQKSDVAVGGISNGKLGIVDRVEFEGKERLSAAVSGNIEFPLYLKGYVGSDYTGNSWDTPNERRNDYINNVMLNENITLNTIFNISYNILDIESQTGLNLLTLENVKSASVSVTNRAGDSNYYVPYGACFNQQDIYKDGVVQQGNPGLQVYNMHQITRVDNIRDMSEEILYYWQEGVYRDVVNQIYTQNGYYTTVMDRIEREIPRSYYYDKNWVDLDLGTADNGYEVYIECVRNYLKDNYEYSLSPGKLGENEDFVNKFMNDKKGYCTHFATLATLMFRSYGIPARYVEGYYVMPDSEQLQEYNKSGATIISVDDRRAHAWTEIYINGYGWMPVEVTPGYGGLNYHYIDKSLVENPTQGNNNSPSTPATTEGEKDLTTGETDGTETKDTANEDGDEQYVKIDLQKLTVWLLTLGIISTFTFILGRKSFKDKKLEDIIGGDDMSKAVRMWENQLLYAMELSGQTFSVNEDRKTLSEQLAGYVEEALKEGRGKYTVSDGYSSELQEMYRIFDKASYGNEMISGEEKEMAEAVAEMSIKYLYLLEKRHRRIFMKYIKCLYLK